METASGLFRIPCLGRSLRRIGLGTNAESPPVATLDGSMHPVVEEFPSVMMAKRSSLCIFTLSVITLLTTDLRPACATGKTGLRRFDDVNMTPYPSNCSIDDPRLPPLGRCDCNVCNSCVLAMERKLGEMVEYPCPNCGNGACFFKEIKIWPVSHEVFMKNASCQRQKEETVDGGH